jgi:hypothetical protein
MTFDRPFSDAASLRRLADEAKTRFRTIGECLDVATGE